MEFLCSSPRSADVEDTLYSKDFSLSWDRKMYNIQLMRGSRLYLLLVSRRRLLEQTIEEFELLNEKLRGLLGMKTFNPPSVSMTTEELIRSVYVKKDMISHQLERVNVNEIFGVYDRETNSVMGQTRDYTMQVVPRLGGPYTYINSLTESQVAARMQELPNAQSAFAWLKKERMVNADKSTSYSRIKARRCTGAGNTGRDSTSEAAMQGRVLTSSPLSN
eukprot:757394-Hanusia_phi.AAC.7